MIAPTHLGLAGPLCRAQASLQSSLHILAFSRINTLDLMSIDLRFALRALIARPLLKAADAVVGHIMDRAWQGARLAQRSTAAATMVAAARR